MVYGHGGRVSQRRPTGGSQPQPVTPGSNRRAEVRRFPPDRHVAVAPIDRAYPPRAMARWQPEGPTFPFP